jgi:hypothetical protein
VADRKNNAGWQGFDATGRQQCLTCWKWQFPILHSCPGVPQPGRKPPEGVVDQCPDMGPPHNSLTHVWEDMNGQESCLYCGLDRD